MTQIKEILKQAEIASPCPMKWEDMEGDDKTRFCQKCQLNVYNTIVMSDEEVLDLVLLAATGQRVCASIFKRVDGTVITRDCPVGVSLWKERLQERARRAAAIVAGALSFLVSAAVSAAPIKCKTTQQSKPLFHATVKADAPGRVGENPKPARAVDNRVLGTYITGQTSGYMAVSPITEDTLKFGEDSLTQAEKKSGKDSAEAAHAHERLARMYRSLNVPDLERAEMHFESAYQIWRKMGQTKNAKAVAQQQCFVYPDTEQQTERMAKWLKRSK